METSARACQASWLGAGIRAWWPPFLLAVAAELAWLSALAWLALR